MDSALHVGASFCYGGLLAHWLMHRRCSKNSNEQGKGASSQRGKASRLMSGPGVQETAEHVVLVSQLRQPFFLLSFVLRGVLLHAVLAQLATLQVNMSGTSSMGTIHFVFKVLKAGMALCGFVWPIVDAEGYRCHHIMWHNSAYFAQLLPQAFRIFCSHSPKQVQLVQTVMQGMLVVVHQDSWQAAAVQLCFVNMLQAVVVVVCHTLRANQQGYSQHALAAHVAQAVSVVLLLWFHQVQPWGEREELVAVRKADKSDAKCSLLQKLVRKLTRQPAGCDHTAGRGCQAAPDSTPDVAFAPYMKRASMVHTTIAIAGLFKAVEALVSIRTGKCTLGAKGPSLLFKSLINPFLFSAEMYGLVSPSTYAQCVKRLHIFFQVGFLGAAWLPLFVEGPSVNDPQQIKIFVTGSFAAALAEADPTGEGEVKLLALKIGVVAAAYVAAACRWHWLGGDPSWKVKDVLQLTMTEGSVVMVAYLLARWVSVRAEQPPCSRTSEGGRVRWLSSVVRTCRARLQWVVPVGCWMHPETKAALWNAPIDHHDNHKLGSIFMLLHQLLMLVLAGTSLEFGLNTGLASCVTVLTSCLLLLGTLYLTGAVISCLMREWSGANRRLTVRLVVLYVPGFILRACGKLNGNLGLLDSAIVGTLAAVFHVPPNLHFPLHITTFFILYSSAALPWSHNLAFSVSQLTGINLHAAQHAQQLLQPHLHSMVAYYTAYLPVRCLERHPEWSYLQRLGRGGWLIAASQGVQLMVVYAWGWGAALAGTAKECGFTHQACTALGITTITPITSFLGRYGLWLTLLALVLTMFTLLPLLMANNRMHHQQYSQLQWYNKQQGKLTVASVETASRVWTAPCMQSALVPLLQLAESAYSQQSVYVIIEPNAAQCEGPTLRLFQSGLLPVAEEVSDALKPHRPILALLDQCVCLNNSGLFTFEMQPKQGPEVLSHQGQVLGLLESIRGLWEPKAWVSCPLRINNHRFGSLLIVSSDAEVDVFFCCFTANLARQLARLVHLYRSMQDMEANNSLLTDILPSRVANRLKKKMAIRRTTESRPDSPGSALAPTPTILRHSHSSPTPTDAMSSDEPETPRYVAHPAMSLSSSKTLSVSGTEVSGMSGNKFRDSSVPVLQDWHENVSVLFADIVGYTALSHGLEPEKVMTMLHALFTKVDLLCSKWGVYKVETIGDCYVAATGLIQESPTHATDLVMFARDMLAAAESIASPVWGQVRLRIGIHSGKVMSGVVGAIRARYCLFGETANKAAKMESTGVPEGIQVSSSTYHLLTPELQAMFTSRDISDTQDVHDERYVWEQPTKGQFSRGASIKRKAIPPVLPDAT